MPSTVKIRKIRDVLNNANPNDLEDAIRKILLGDMLKTVDETITIASGTAINLETDSAFKRAAHVVQSVRVVTGAATGNRAIGDAGATPSTTLVALSADGKTITFEAAITVARVVWVPKAKVDIDLEFEKPV